MLSSKGGSVAAEFGEDRKKGRMQLTGFVWIKINAHTDRFILRVKYQLTFCEIGWVGRPFVVFIGPARHPLPPIA